MKRPLTSRMKAEEIIARQVAATFRGREAKRPWDWPARLSYWLIALRAASI